MKSGQVNFCLGELILKWFAQIGEWHQNLSEKTVLPPPAIPHPTPPQLTDTCENITFPQLRLRAVKYFSKMCKWMALISKLMSVLY